MLRLPVPLAVVVAFAAACSDDAVDVRTVGSVRFGPSELGRPVAAIESPDGHGTVAVVNGYLMVIDSSDAGGAPDDGGIELWDLADPRAPVRVARYDDERTHRLREPHGFGLARIGARSYAALQTLEGIQIWDCTDVPALTLCADLDLPGIEAGNYAGNWWVCWQGRHIYVGGRNAGLFVVDAIDPYAPVLANHLPTGELGGIGPSIVQAIGNLLVVTSNPSGAILTMDASDPVRPEPIAVEFGPRGYSHLFAGGLLLEPGGQGDPERLYVHRIGHDGSITPEPAVGDALGDGGYGAIQDGVFHAGFSDHALRFDLASRALVGSGTTGVADADEDFAVPLGNVTFIGNDHEGRSALVPHAMEPDTTGPEVTWVHPADGALGAATTTRVGLSMSDQIDLRSLGPAWIRLRPVGVPTSSPTGIPARLGLQGAIVNLEPEQPLAPGTTYEVVVDGLRDVVGNAGPAFRSTFRTGAPPSGNAGPPRISAESLGPSLVGDAILFDVDLVGGGVPTGYSWDFGDGSPPTPPSPFPATSHTYAAPGRYTAIVTATNASGQGGAAAVQIVHRPLAALLTRSASSIAEGASLLYVANHDNDTVTAILGSTSAKAWEVPVPARPTSVAVDAQDRVWVTCRDADRVVVLDGTNGATLADLALDHGAAPGSLVLAEGAIDPIVCLEGEERVVRLAFDGTIGDSADVGRMPRGLAITGDGACIFVTPFLAGGSPARVLELDGATLAVARDVELADDPGPDTEASGRGRPNYLGSIAITPDEHSALVASKKDNVVRGGWRDGLDLDFESTVRTIVSRVDLGTGTEDLGARVDLNDRSLAQSCLTSPRGDLVFVAVMGSNAVEVYDTWRGEHVAELPVGAGPRGLAINRLASKLFVHETLDRAVSVFDIRDLLAGRAADAPRIARTSLVATEALAPNVLRGKRIFHDATDLRMARDGYHSCATCHLEGGGDAAVWDFMQLGEGLRNTVPLTGRAGLGHGLLHWSANFDEVQDFEGPIRSLGGGFGFLDAAQFAATADPLGAPKAGLSVDLDDLAAYVASLDEFPRSPHRDPSGARTAAGIRGETVFTTSGCAACHAPPTFTDGLRHDVGTALPSSGLGNGAPLGGVGFDTPTLRGVWATAPYLHDGRLRTLEDVLALPGHGAALGPADRADLAAYLRELE
ncbi:MAG: Ig-like domain-containing protein [Planctomycetota bacterium]